MEKQPFAQLISWANSQIGHYAMTGYILKEVNEATARSLSIILAEYHQKEPIAEVSISTEGDGYQGSFQLLPEKEGPLPQPLTLKTADVQELLEWLSTGHTPKVTS